MPKSRVVSENPPETASGFRILTFYCPAELVEPLRKMAYDCEVSRSKIIVEALKEYIDQYRRIYPDFMERQDGNI